jgi:hypothetical protein
MGICRAFIGGGLEVLCRTAGDPRGVAKADLNDVGASGHRNHEREAAHH